MINNFACTFITLHGKFYCRPTTSTSVDYNTSACMLNIFDIIMTPTSNINR